MARISRGQRGPAARFVSFRGHRFGFWRGGPRRFYWRGAWRTLVAFGALGTIYYGTQLYYPTGYVTIARPYCEGETENGCTLTWRDVPTEEGAVIPQCVQYCPRGVEPVSAYAQEGPAPAPTGNEDGCEVQGFSDPDLQGQSFTTSDNYPTMDEWNDQVASLQIKAGTWDFFSDENFGGEVLRLTPGSYGNLGEAWTHQISSFMCSQPGNEQQSANQPR